MSRDEGFVRISELAKRANVLASTIRHYTDMGLLTPAMDTEGGHRLYDPEQTLKRLRLIQAMSRRGKTLLEIKEEMDKRCSVAKVLIVDDEEEVISLLKDALESWAGNRCDIHIARDGFSAGRLSGEILPDFLILDLMLPGLNGIEVCRVLRADPDLSGLKILAISGYDTPENSRGILAAGADDYLVKPFAMADLKAKLKNLGMDIK